MFPMQNDQLQEKMSQSSAFAECLNKPKTKIFFEFLSYKTRYRENIGIEVKGGNKKILPCPEQENQQSVRQSANMSLG